MITWERVRLGSLVETQKGYAFKSGWYCLTGTPVVKVSDFTNDSVDNSNLVRIPESIAANYRKYELSVGDVVVQTVGSWPTNPASVVGKCVSIPTEAAGALLNQNAVKLSPANGFDRRFLFYLLRSEQFKSYIIGTAQGAASQAAITLEAIRGFEFALPPFKVQQRIASILSAYDELIDNDTRRIRILEEMAQALYREWFLHFRFPGHEKARFVVSALGKLPSGWQTENLFDVANVTYGFPFKSELFSEKPKGKRVIRIRDIPNGKTKTWTTEKVDDKYIVRNGDLVVGMDGDFHIGKWAGGEAYLNQRVVRFRPKQRLPVYYLFLALRKPIEHFDSTIVGTTVAHLGDKHLRTIKLAIPPAEIVEKLHRILDPIFGLEMRLQEANTNLRRTRDLLLPKLISGEIELGLEKQ